MMVMVPPVVNDAEPLAFALNDRSPFAAPIPIKLLPFVLLIVSEMKPPLPPAGLGTVMGLSAIIEKGIVAAFVHVRLFAVKVSPNEFEAARVMDESSKLIVPPVVGLAPTLRVKRDTAVGRWTISSAALFALMDRLKFPTVPIPLASKFVKVPVFCHPHITGVAN